MNKAPWTPEEVVSLNAYQAAGLMHPFTCPRCRTQLVATDAGWICVRDDYTQDWAHEFMADKSWQQPTLDKMLTVFSTARPEPPDVRDPGPEA